MDEQLRQGVEQVARGRIEEALASFRRAVALDPASAAAHYQLGFTLSLQGRLDEAALHARRAVTLDPSHAEAHNNLGYIHLSQGRLEEAVHCYQLATALKPEYAKAHYNLGLALCLMTRLEAAAVSFRRAIAADSGMGEAYYNLGNVLYRQGKPDEAANCYRQALALRPDNIEIHHNLASLLFKQDRLDESAACYRQALALRPYAEAYYDLGIILTRQGRLDEAATSYRKALEFKPEYGEAWCNLAQVLCKQGRPEEAVECCKAALTVRPELAYAHSSLNMMLLYTSAHPEAEKAAARRGYAEQFEAPLKRNWRPHANHPDPERKLKIGYVSPDFRHHAVAFFLEPIMAHHDKTQVELYGYYTHTQRDQYTDRIAAMVEHWLPCSGLSDDTLAGCIRNDGIDILIDLAGHTADNRLPVFARKPAPVQVTYLGYPASTGLSAMDYRLTTRDLDPEGNTDWHSERLYRLPRTLWCYRPPADFLPALDASPAARRRFFTFGSMNNLFKISPETIALWSEILRRVPESRLVMTNVPDGSARELLLERFAAHGIDAGRMMLHGKLPAEEFRAISRDIDLALDPIPYNGTTTTCESLWMGIPVISLIGQTSVSRSGYALLKTADLAELAARDEAGYVRLAIDLARNTDRLTELRHSVRRRMETSPLRDEAGMARDIEQAYRAMWREWCALRTRIMS